MTTALQQPGWVYMGGRLRRWEEATLHVSTEAVTRGLSVYEGIKGYWSSDRREFGLIALRRHYDRLCRSARLMHIPFALPFVDFEAACHELIAALLTTEQDMWLRATLYVVEGHWGEGTAADLVLTAYHQPCERPAAISVGVSSWQRASDAVLPPRVKTGPNYAMARIARIEGRSRGHGEMIMLNQFGRVAEATGSCVLLVRDGRVCTPPASEGRLESITVEIVGELCAALEIPFVERPLDRTELYIADELALAGTLSELVPVHRIDGFELPAHRPVLERIADRFWATVRDTDGDAEIARSRVALPARLVIARAARSAAG